MERDSSSTERPKYVGQREIRSRKGKNSQQNVLIVRGMAKRTKKSVSQQKTVKEEKERKREREKKKERKEKRRRWRGVA